MNRYRLYGLTVASDVPLPAPRVDSPQCDLTFELAARSTVPVPAHEPRFVRTVGDGGTLRIFEDRAGNWIWDYPDGTRFWVGGDGRHVRATWPDHYTSDDALTYALGPILGFALSLRGTPTLHAGTVVVDGSAVAFTGGPTAGKSTLTAELVARGFELLTEDFAAFDEERGRFFVRPGLAIVKLWSDSASRHGELPALSPNWPKRYWHVDTGALASQSAPLGAIYLLDYPLGAVSPAEALVAMMQNVYVGYAGGAAMRERDLALFGRLVDSIPVRGLPRAPSLDRIEERVENLVTDLRGLR